MDWLHSNDVTFFFLASGLPDFLIADSRFPLVAIDLYLENDLAFTGEDRADELLAAKVKELGQLLPSELSPSVEPVVLSFPDNPERDMVAWGADFVLDELTGDRPDEKLLSFLSKRFPQSGLFPNGTPSRASKMGLGLVPPVNLELDAEQSRIVDDIGDFVDVISGAAGSGKTLLLAARAKRIFEVDPGAKVLFICFNGALRNYIEYLMRNTSVEVSHWHDFSRSNGFRDKSSFEVDNSEKDLLHSPKPKQKYDAVLVDETQDFWPGWLKYLEMFVKPEKYGLSLAGDRKQSLFLQFDSLNDDFEGFSRKLRRFNLERTYRTTRQISEVIGALEPSFSIPKDSRLQEGPKVEVTFADKKDRSEALLADIELLREGQPEFSFSDCVVLIPTYYFLRGLDSPDKVLKASGVPTTVIWKNKWKDLNLSDDTVKIMSVHGAKGLEFRNVFILGLDELFLSEKIQRESDVQKVQNDTRLRILLVGPSRSKERLHIYYSRSSVFIDRLSGVEDFVSYQVYPDDY